MANTYTAPLKDIYFVIRELAQLQDINQLPDYVEASDETVWAILEEKAKFVASVVAPLNHASDKTPSYIKNGEVFTSPGFKEAFKQYVEGGWQSLQHPVTFGGQGLPKLVSTACLEMLNAASLSFALCPLLTNGVIEALLIAGSEAQRSLYLTYLVSGQWTGTMNLTEPQAGSDLALIKTRAMPTGDGTFLVSGTKIFITYGDHDLADNIVHMVLARTPNAPPGVKGLSLFLVPKYLVNDDGSLGAKNDVVCVSLEHKLGIKASPTAVLQYGDNGGAVGFLVGEENRGLEYMFIMMNAARFAVGVQGIAIAERAYQQAVGYAKERIQSRELTGSEASVPIIHHPDVKRLLMSMRAWVEASRALAYVASAYCDLAEHHPIPAMKEQKKTMYEFLVPIVKGFSTEMALEVTSTAIQVYGGMGFIEETGVAQYYRDARILTIYEGTTAIQANDLVSRKTVRDNGATARLFLEAVKETVSELERAANKEIAVLAPPLLQAALAMEEVVAFVLGYIKTDIKAVFAGSVPYLKLAGYVLSAWQMARAALLAQAHLVKGEGDASFYQAKIITARFFMEHCVVQVPGIKASIVSGSSSILGLEDHQF